MRLQLSKRFFFAITLITLPFFYQSCQVSSRGGNSDLPTIHTTLFITYDMARAIVGDYMNVELFLPPGIDTHTFEPSISDMLRLRNSNLFIWTSIEMEPWVPRIISAIDMPASVSLNIAEHMGLDELNPEVAHHHGDSHSHEHHHGEGHHQEHHAHEHHMHDHHGHSHDHHDHAHHGHSHGHVHEHDPHFWMNPNTIPIMVQVILNAVIEVEPTLADTFRTNALLYTEEFMQELSLLESQMAASAARPLLFGGGFSHQLFLDAYNLAFFTVYQSDSIENEPTIQHMANTRAAIVAHNLRHIFVDPILTTRIAAVLADDYDLTILPWHTGHTLTSAQLAQGVTYLDLFRENRRNIITALGE